MAGLLAGTRVLDLTNVLAGPFCCYQLAQLGAEVIKVEVPGSGDLARQLGADPELNRRGMGASFLAQNAGKRSITLNLKSPKGRDAFERLVATSDVVVENFRPGVMDRLGLGYTALKVAKPDLIYCAISGFGQSGPLKLNPAYDQIIQGLCGVMSVTGDAQSAPLRVGYPVADTMGGITAAFAIAAALFRRERTGEGEFIDVSMLESSLVAMGWAVSNWLIAGVKPAPMGNENMTASPSGTFRTGDGLLNIAANKQEQFETLARLIGREDLVADPRFAAREDRKQRRFELNRELEKALAARSAQDWSALLNRNGVPAGEVLDVPSVLEHPQIVERGLLKTFESVPDVDRPVTVVRSGFRLGSGDPEPARRRRRSAPTLKLCWPSWVIRSATSTSSRGTVRYDRPAATPRRPEDWWSTSIIDMQPGMIRYRGYAIEDLIGRIGFAEMVYLMTRGELPHPARRQAARGRIGGGGRPWPAGALDRGGQDGDHLRGRHQQCHGLGRQHARRRAWRRRRAMRRSYNAIADRLIGTRPSEQRLAEAVRAEIKALAERGVRHVPGFGHRFHPGRSAGAPPAGAGGRRRQERRGERALRRHRPRDRGAACGGEGAADPDEHRWRDRRRLCRARLSAAALPRACSCCPVRSARWPTPSRRCSPASATKDQFPAT